jgi:hypothetical protein
MVSLDTDELALEEARSFAVLRRTAEIAGREAVRDAAAAEALRHVVLNDHVSTVAHLMLSGRKYEGMNLSTDAADLRREIDDRRPGGGWIRAAELLGGFVAELGPEMRAALLESFADFMTGWNSQSADHFKTMADDERRRTRPDDVPHPPETGNV